MWQGCHGWMVLSLNLEKKINVYQSELIAGLTSVIRFGIASEKIPSPPTEVQIICFSSVIRWAQCDMQDTRPLTAQ